MAYEYRKYSDIEEFIFKHVTETRKMVRNTDINKKYTLQINFAGL